MLTAQRVLVISPHLDDAALSVGALLADLAAGGTEVCVLTSFAGPPSGKLSPVAGRFHDMCRLPRGASAVTLRRAEDYAAMTVLGVRAHHDDFQDAVYRRGDGTRWVCEHDRSMFETHVPPEPLLLQRLITRIEEVRSGLRPDLILTCAAIGGHVDHRATRDAVTAVIASSGQKVLLWEDLPYGMGGDPIQPRDAYKVTSSPEAWLRKWRSIACYASQTRMLWPDGQDWRSLLQAHARRRGEGQLAELLWDPHQAPADR